MPAASQNPEQVLVVPFADGIGDFVMLLPLLDAICGRFPEAAITVAASQRSALLLSERQAAALTVRTPSWLQGRPRPRGGPLRKLIPQSWLAAVAGQALQVELGRFDRTLNLFRWWEQGVDFARYWTPRLPPLPGAQHTLDYLAARLERELGVDLPPARRAPRVAPTPIATAWAERWWETAALDSRPVVGLVPSSNMGIKRWPVARWRQLHAALAASGATPLYFLPPDEPDAGFAAGYGSPLVVQEPLDRVAALLARCHLVIGVDTGLLHLAAAVGTRYVGLFGPTNPLVTGPYNRSLGTALVAPFQRNGACDGCWRQFKYIDDRCFAAPGSSCLASLSFDRVLAACQAELARALAQPAAAATSTVSAAVSPR